jgi:hypothetical protein
MFAPQGEYSVNKPVQKDPSKIINITNPPK